MAERDTSDGTLHVVTMGTYVLVYDEGYVEYIAAGTLAMVVGRYVSTMGNKCLKLLLCSKVDDARVYANTVYDFMLRSAQVV